MSIVKISKIIFWISIFALFSFLGYLGFVQQRWFHHLSGDPKLYYSIAVRVFEHREVLGFERSLLYPPAANIYFGLVNALSFPWFIRGEEVGFLAILCGLNFCLLAILVFLYKKYSPGWTWLFILGSAGPIVLFRYDLIPVLLVVVGVLLFQKNKVLASGLVIGFAISVKIFPIFLLPYFLLVLVRNHKYVSCVKFLGLVGMGIALPILFYIMVSGQSVISIIDGFKYNLTKTVHVESLLGTLLTLNAWPRFSTPPWVEFTNGILGLSFQYTLGRDRLFRYLWLPVFGLFYIIFIWLKKKDFKTISFSGVATILFGLVTFSNVVSPQYLLWPILLLPLLKTFKLDVMLACLALLLTQAVYPVGYDVLYWNFYQNWTGSWVYLILLARNMILVLLTFRFLKYYD